MRSEIVIESIAQLLNVFNDIIIEREILIYKLLLDILFLSSILSLFKRYFCYSSFTFYHFTLLLFTCLFKYLLSNRDKEFFILRKLLNYDSRLVNFRIFERACIIKLWIITKHNWQDERENRTLERAVIKSRNKTRIILKQRGIVNFRRDRGCICRGWNIRVAKMV